MIILIIQNIYEDKYLCKVNFNNFWKVSLEEVEVFAKSFQEKKKILIWKPFEILSIYNKRHY